MTSMPVLTARRLSSSARRRPALRPLVLAMACLGLTPALAQTLPTGFRQIAGGVSVVQPNAATLNVQQSTGRAIAQWESFSIGPGGTVNIAQPGAGSVLLNRVVGSELSSIAGTLKANGQVFLVNPNGVMFGRTASVSVGGLIASTLDIGNGNFMSGKLVFERADGNVASVVNAGKVQAGPGGMVALLAETVRNEGEIHAAGGTVGLVSGRQISIDPAGDGLMTFRVAADAKATRALVENAVGAAVSADGGRVVLLADGNAPGRMVVNQQGTVRAQSMSTRHGEIVLGGSAGDVDVAGVLDATGAQPGLSGGRVAVDGAGIRIGGGAVVDASGAGGGGDIRVHASGTTTLAQGSAMRADAGQTGHGGRVVALGDEKIEAHGELSARGGALQGDGGFVETSGRNFDVSGLTVDTRAAAGAVGEWLLDPVDIRIAAGSGAAANTFYDSGIVAALNTSNLTISTAGAGSQAGDITFGSGVNVNYTGAAARTLRFEATQRIESNTAAVAPVIRSTGSGALNVDFIANADNVVGGFGQINFTGTLQTLGGRVTMQATGAESSIALSGASINTLGLFGSGGGAVNIATVGQASGVNQAVAVNLNNSTITTGAGNVSISSGQRTAAAAGGTGVRILGGAIATTSGDVSISGDGRENYANIIAVARIADPDVPTAQTFGVDLDGTSVSTVGGNIAVAGRGFATTNPSPGGPIPAIGVALRNGARLESTGAGDIEVTGGAVIGGSTAAGIVITEGVSPAQQAQIVANQGDVTLRASSAGFGVSGLDIAGPVRSQAGSINVRVGAVGAAGPSDSGNFDIHLGGTGGAIALTTAEIALLSAPNLVFGSQGGGDVRLLSALNSTSNLTFQTGTLGGVFVNAALAAPTVALLSGEGVTQTAGITATSLFASASNGSVSLGNANNQIGTVAGSATGRFDLNNNGTITTGGVSFRNAQGVQAIGTGVLGNAVALTATSGDVRVGANVTGLASAVLESQAGDVVLESGRVAAPNVVLAAAGSVTQATGAGAAITADGLAATATTGAVSLLNAANSVGILAGRAAGRFDYLNASDLSIGSVNSGDPLKPVLLDGIEAASVRVRTVTGDLAVSSGVTAQSTALLEAGSGGVLVVDAPVVATDLALLGGSVGGLGSVTASRLLAVATDGDVSLVGSGNRVGALAGSAAGRFDYLNLAALDIGSVSVADPQQPLTGAGIRAADVRVETATGTLNVVAPLVATSTAFLRTQEGGDIRIAAPVSATDMVLDAGGSVLQSTDGDSAIAATTLLARGRAGDVLLTSPANTVGTIAGSAMGRFDFADANALAIGNLSVSNAFDSLAASGIAADTVRVRTLSQDLTLGADVTGTTTTDLVAAERFQNAGAYRISGATWRIWARTWEGESRGGLAGSGVFPNFYNCTYGGFCGVTVPAADNHFIYTQQPVATVTLGSASYLWGTSPPEVGYTLSGLVLGDTGAGISGTQSTAAGRVSPPGTYAVSGDFSSAEGYAVNVVPGSLTIGRSPLQLDVAQSRPDVLRELPTTWLYDRNIGAAPMCFATGPLQGDGARQGGDVLAREWSRVRSRPNLTNCVDTERRNGCADF